MEQDEPLLVALGTALGVLLLAIAVLWRRMLAKSRGLPIWRFLRREGIARDDTGNALGKKAVRQAELACSVCGNKDECLTRLAAGKIAAPPPECRNARLFQYFGRRTDRPPQ